MIKPPSRAKDLKVPFQIPPIPSQIKKPLIKGAVKDPSRQGAVKDPSRLVLEELFARNGLHVFNWGDFDEIRVKLDRLFVRSIVLLK